MILQEEAYGFISLYRLACSEGWDTVSRVMAGGVGEASRFGGIGASIFGIQGWRLEKMKGF
jgi:hypothetical protein